MKSLLIISFLLMGACSKEEDFSISSKGYRCIEGDLRTMNIKVTAHEGRQYISVYGNRSMGNQQQGCVIIVDQKSHNVVRLFFSQ